MMKICLPKDYKHQFTLSEYETARDVISDFKGYDFKSDAHIALNHYVSKNEEARKYGSYQYAEIIKLEAEIVKDQFIDYNSLCEISGYMNIWLKITAFSSINGFIILEIPLTDVWNMSEEEADFTRAYIREFKEIP